MVKDHKPIETKMETAIIEFLIDIPIFDSLGTDELKNLSRHMSFMDFQPNEIVFEEGEKGDYVCFVVKGSLEVLKKNETGKYAQIAVLTKGRSMGEMAVIDNFPRSATVRAESESTLLILTKERFDQLLDQYPEIGVKILKGISRLLSMSLRKTSSRLADYMLPLS